MNRRKTGAAYEEKAAAHLSGLGYEILERNYRCRQGEIDLIAKDGGTLVFLEVKYRRDAKGGHPLEAVDIRKQRRICKTAAYYCLRYGYGEHTPCRFDVIGILEKEIIHIENAFPFQY